ncbi:MAG: hypothetical protein GY793_05640 [Proteobacteria bacterium]|nr:hypothetical protein [Pseudomonadota bacterium]
MSEKAKKKFSNFFTGVIVLVIAVIVGAGFGYSRGLASSTPTRAVIVKVEQERDSARAVLEQLTSKGLVSPSILHEMEKSIRYQKDGIKEFGDFIYSKDEFTVAEIKDNMDCTGHSLNILRQELSNMVDLQAKYNEVSSEAVLLADGIKNIATMADEMVESLSIMHKKIFELGGNTGLTSMQLKKSISEIENETVSSWLFELSDQYFEDDGRSKVCSN